MSMNQNKEPRPYRKKINSFWAKHPKLSVFYIWFSRILAVFLVVCFVALAIGFVCSINKDKTLYARADSKLSSSTAYGWASTFDADIARSYDKGIKCFSSESYSFSINSSSSSDGSSSIPISVNCAGLLPNGSPYQRWLYYSVDIPHPSSLLYSAYNVSCFAFTPTKTYLNSTDINPVTSEYSFSVTQNGFGFGFSDSSEISLISPSRTPRCFISYTCSAILLSSVHVAYLSNDCMAFSFCISINYNVDNTAGYINLPFAVLIQYYNTSSVLNNDWITASGRSVPPSPDNQDPTYVCHVLNFPYLLLCSPIFFSDELGYWVPLNEDHIASLSLTSFFSSDTISVYRSADKPSYLAPTYSSSSLYSGGYSAGFDSGYNQGASGSIRPLWLVNFADSFLSFNFFGGFSVANLLAIVIAVMLTLTFLKFFAGG